jgi:phosphoribosylformimino-5-aminoimidazole carboxamide ribotide isomerase
MTIIPAIDILGGQCVRLSRGDYGTKKLYYTDPLSVAKTFEDNGITHLHLVDLDGARSQCIVNAHILEDICSKTSLHVDFGGGVKSDQDLQIAFSAGAAQVTAGTLAARDPAQFKQWLDTYGSDTLILGADCRKRMIATSGWHEETDIDVIDFINSFEQDGLRHVICTDIDKDGMLAGPSLDLYQEILRDTDIGLIASGGISSIDDLHRLADIGCTAAIVGKAIYEGRISLEQIRDLC